jgi:aspartyl-tRNA synthetase
MRTHYCGQITESLLDQEVKICGWIHRIRNHGGIIFINLRDRYGIVQTVINPEDPELFRIAEKLHIEDVIQIRGLVRPRPHSMVNLEMTTGKIEIIAEDLQIFSQAEPLPFPVAEEQNVNDELRLKYRYLDLRKPKMTNNIVLRARVAKALRHFLDKHNFLEIETPVLTKATPEGARDFLVPSRIHPGSFYALPQSPQIFKQLLMMSGLDRYYQIVRCFRDEDLRADRQPEFTQLDIETSFMSQNQILDLMEEMMRQLFLEVLGVALPTPFPRITYDEAMDLYGSDKPDLRIPLELIDVEDLVKDCEFKIFSDAAKDHDSRVAALRIPGGAKLSRKELEKYEELAKKYGAKGLAHIKVFDLKAGMAGLQSSILKFFANDMITEILKRVAAQDNDIIFFVADKTSIADQALGALRVQLGHDFNLVEGGWRPLWVVDFPMFIKTEEGITFMHHPFTSPVETDPNKLKANPEKSLAYAYDMVLNGNEIGGGSLRIYKPEMQKAVFSVLGIDNEMAEKQFGHLLTAFKYGCPPHGGVAFGLDRIVMLMAGEDSIREVIAFPKTANGICPLTGAPTEVSQAQLKELKIKK